MPTVLHVGCGRAFLPQRFAGWKEIRLDADPEVKPDIVASATAIPLETGSVDAVFCSHMLEHLFAHEVLQALCEFHRVLLLGGFVTLAVPNLAFAAAAVDQFGPEETLYESPAGPIAALDMIYGHRQSIAEGKRLMAHKTGFTLGSLRRILKVAGFNTIPISPGMGLDIIAEGTK